MPSLASSPLLDLAAMFLFAAALPLPVAVTSLLSLSVVVMLLLGLTTAPPFAPTPVLKDVYSGERIFSWFVGGCILDN